MFPQKHIEGFKQYWLRRKPGSSTAVHYTSDVRIFFKWASVCSPEVITAHDVDNFIEWQLSSGRAPTTIRRRLIALRMFFDYLTYVKDQEVPNPVIPRRHYLSQGRNLPRSVRQNEMVRLFASVGDHLRDRTIFTLMLHAGLRIGEVINLHTRDIYLSENRTPHLRLNGKGQR